MMKMKSFFTLTIICLVSLQAWSQSFYVATGGSNNNTGTEASPWKTIQYAVDQVDAGATIYVKTGTYSEKVVFDGSSDAGSSGNLITLINAEGEAPVIDGQNLSPSGREGLISVIGSSYIKVSGFELRNFTSSGNPTPCGFYMEGTCTDVEFSNNKIHDIINTSTCQDPCGVGAHGIGVFGTTSNGIKNVIFDNNEVYDNILQASEAFVINGNVDGFIQTNNSVYDNNNIGFDYIGYEDECDGCGENDRARNGLVKNNRAINNRSDLTNPWYDGDASAGGFYVDGGKDIVFEGNISTGNNMGFEVASEHDDKSTEDIIIRDNVAYLNTEVGISVGGSVSNASANNISVTNNTFYINHGWGSEIVFQSNVLNSFVQNNIFYADNTEAYEEQGNGNTGNTWSNNLYFNGDAAGGSISTENPRFTDPATGDFSLQASSPAINVGLNSASNIGSEDVLGNGRIVDDIVDLGAYEYGSDVVVIVDYLRVSLDLTFDDQAQSGIVSVESDMNWIVSTSDSWFTVDLVNGSGDGSFEVSVLVNETGSNREGTVTVNGGGITRTVTVTQLAEVIDRSIPIIVATSDVFQELNIPANTFDDNPDTRWSGEGIGVEIFFEFDDLYIVDSMTISFLSGDSRFSFFDVEISTDGVFYTSVNTGLSNSGTTNDEEAFDVNATGRFIKIIGNGNSVNLWNSITEVNFYGEATVITAIDEFYDQFELYPNPVKEELSISLKEENSFENINVIDDLGRVVLSKKIDATNLTINVSELETGAYILQLTGTNEFRTSQFAVTK